MGAVFTGVGIVAPTGMGADAYWKATVAGESAIRRITRYDPSRYPAQLAGEIDAFEATDHLPNRLMPQTDRLTRLALVATDWAFADAGIADPGTREYGEYDMGVVTSNGAGGFEFTHTEISKLWNRGPRHVSVYESFAWFYAVNTGQISIRHGLRGPGGVTVADQAGGIDALGLARWHLARGRKAMVTGGVESSLDPWAWVSHLASRRVSTHTDPSRAFLPFDLDAAGHVPGEGGAVLILEQEEAARDRNAPHRYGVLAGYATTFDPPPGSARPSNLCRTIVLALADAAVRPDDVDVVFADAAAVAALDKSEARAIEHVFGQRGVPVTAPKAGVGRLLAGGGPLDVATALLSMRDGVIPPTPNVTAVRQEYSLDLVLEPRSGAISVVVVIGRGHGGFNSVVVLTR